MSDAGMKLPLARAAAVLSALEHNVRDAVRWAHPSWLAAALGVAPERVDALRDALAQAPLTRVHACSRALLGALGVTLPDFAAWREPGLGVLDALPPEHGLRVLRLRALWMRRAEVRRVIDRRSQMRVSEWAGVAPEQLMHSVPRDAPDIARLIAQGQMVSLDAIDAGTLAQEGHALMVRDANAGEPFCLLRLALPRDLPALPWLGDARGGPDAGGTTQLVKRLPELVPEWAWLFG